MPWCETGVWALLSGQFSLNDHFELASNEFALSHRNGNDANDKWLKFQGTKHTHNIIFGFVQFQQSSRTMNDSHGKRTHTNTFRAFIKYKLGNAAFLVSLLLLLLLWRSIPFRMMSDVNANHSQKQWIPKYTESKEVSADLSMCLCVYVICPSK